MTDQEFIYVNQQIRRTLGIDLSYYKGQQMRRRLDAYLRRSGAPSWADYFRRLSRDTEEQRRLRDYLTINVSSFFRDPEKFQELEQKIFPLIVRRGEPFRMWSAGCSHGAEAYSLAMLAESNSIRPYEVWATDIDRSILIKARTGGPYSGDDVKTVPPLFMRRYFELHQGQYYVKEALRRHVVFEEHNLLEAVSVQAPFDLVVCRNVIIYFSEEAKQRVLRHLVAAMRPGGVLFLGGTEVIAPAVARSLGLRSVGISFYQKMPG
ncbi:MAG: protein-glutamate O-methyltransferase CheR [Anaerolineae bacterium]